MRQILLSNGMVALCDDTDYPFLSQWKWTASRRPNGRWYAERSFRRDGKRFVIRMHQQVAGTFGLSRKVQVDHRNHDGLDNQRENLRVCSPGQNHANQRVQSRVKTSGYKGVSWEKRRGKWQVHIKSNSVQIHVGYFADERQAALAYNAAAIQHFGEFACVNQ